MAYKDLGIWSEMIKNNAVLSASYEKNNLIWMCVAINRTVFCGTCALVSFFSFTFLFGFDGPYVDPLRQFIDWWYRLSHQWMNEEDIKDI